MKRFFGILAVTALVALFSAPQTSEAGGVYIRFRPPPVKKVVVVKRTRPFPRAVWVSGHYQFKRGRYVWVDGHWIKPRRGYVYVQPRWGHTQRGYLYTPGHWVKH